MLNDKRILAVGILLALTGRALAALPAKNAAWLKEHEITIPDDMSPGQMDGLNRMIDNDCAPGPAKVAGMAFKCSGDKVKDVNEYLNTVLATIMYEAWISSPSAVAPQVKVAASTATAAAAQETLVAVSTAAPQVSPPYVLPAKTLAWLNERKITVPDGLSANQLKGLNWLVNHDDKPGPITAGGIPLTCTGDKTADVGNYLNLAVATNLYNAWNSN